MFWQKLFVVEAEIFTPGGESRNQTLSSPKVTRWHGQSTNKQFDPFDVWGQELNTLLLLPLRKMPR